jgi:hypothetical protein
LAFRIAAFNVNKRVETADSLNYARERVTALPAEPSGVEEGRSSADILPGKGGMLSMSILVVVVERTARVGRDGCWGVVAVAVLSVLNVRVETVRTGDDS